LPFFQIAKCLLLCSIMWSGPFPCEAKYLFPKHGKMKHTDTNFSFTNWEKG
jgi:hypothetical protein